MEDDRTIRLDYAAPPPEPPHSRTADLLAWTSFCLTILALPLAAIISIILEETRLVRRSAVGGVSLFVFAVVAVLGLVLAFSARRRIGESKVRAISRRASVVAIAFGLFDCGLAVLLLLQAN
jgi:hypothetical protein